MAGGGKGNAPAPPNFNAAATPDQTNAFGASSKWGQSYDSPVPDWVNNPKADINHDQNQAAADAWKQQHTKYSQTQSFSGPLADAASGLEGQFRDANASPLDNGATARQKAEDAIYGRAASRLDPMWNTRQHDMQTQLANQGIDPNSAAYSKASDNFGRARNDAYSTAMQDAIMGGGQEASRQQGMDIQSRNAPLSSLLGLSGLAGQSQNPLLASEMAKYQGALQSYGIQQQGKNSALGGLTNLGGTLGAAGILA